MSRTIIVEFSLNFTNNVYSMKDIKEYVESKLKAFYTLTNLKISQI